MARHLLLSDPHATVHPPSSCTDLYWPDVRSLLWQSVELARREKVVSVTWAGDVLHHKAPLRTSPALLQELARIVQAYPCPAYATPGNHDMQHDRPESIEATQPLGVLFLAGLRRLEGWADRMFQDAERREYGMLPLYGVPWQQHWSEMGIEAALDQYREQVAGRRFADSTRVLVVTHAPLYPPDKEPTYPGAECTPARWWSSAMGSTGSVFYGHVHEMHGRWEDAGTQFCNNGALSRGSLGSDNLERQVGCTIWDDQTGEFRFCPLDAVPAAELFRLEEHGRKVTSQAQMGEFLASVGQVRLPVLSVEGVIEEIKRRGLPARVVTKAEELLTAAAHEKGKR
jgi:DNA repair exonuclease SbcCD nuclease subunit